MKEQKLAGRLRELEIQEIGGTRKTVEAGVAFVREALTDANNVKREPVSASELTVALQCGGSDGYSGVSANPALGAASDLLVRHGGTVILSETPETYGAEHLLTRRAVSREVGEKLVALMRWWEEYTAREGAEMNANPSPGNKAGGLTTILEKSLGAMAKDRGEPAGLVAGRGIGIHLGALPRRVFFPPAHQRHQFFADLAADRASRQQMFGAVGLRRLRQNDRAAVPYQEIAGSAQRRIGGDAGIAVGAAALQRHRQLAGRDLLTLDVVGIGERLAHE